MVVVKTLAPGNPGQEPPVVGGVLEVLAAAPVAERIDERRHHEDIEARVQEPGDEAGPEPDEHTEQAQSDPDAEVPAREKQPIEPIRLEIRGERLQGLGDSRLQHVISDGEKLDAPQAAETMDVGISTYG